jgi:RNA polymerase sigma factor (sigma-70 family)
VLNSSLHLEPLVFAAARGDHSAWAELIRRFKSHLTRLVRSLRVPAHDVEDVVQLTFIRLYENLGNLRDPNALPGWLDTTARRETLRSIRVMLRERPLDVGVIESLQAASEPAEDADEALRAELWRAIAGLPERQRTLMEALNRELSYEEIAARFAMPIGSIGPTRGRALEKLRGDLSLRVAWQDLMGAEA